MEHVERPAASRITDLGGTTLWQRLARPRPMGEVAAPGTLRAKSVMSCEALPRLMRSTKSPGFTW